eukprot:12512020-Ditylum_brightwellii.AAC.1
MKKGGIFGGSEYWCLTATGSGVTACGGTFGGDAQSGVFLLLGVCCTIGGGTCLCIFGTLGGGT